MDHYFVLLPSPTTNYMTVHSITAAFSSMIQKLEMKEASIREISIGEHNKLSVTLGERNGVPTDTPSTLLEGEKITWNTSLHTSTSEAATYLRELNQVLYKWSDGFEKDELLSFSKNESGTTLTFEKVKVVRKEHETVSTSKPVLLLIDGSNVLSSAYFATEQNLLQNRKGLYTNAVFPMARRFLSLLRKYKPTHVAICWDVDRDTFRRQLHAGYKGEREETPAALKEQFATAKKLFHRMGIKQSSVKGFEADDLIGTLTSKWRTQFGGESCYIVSNDKDLYQLLAPGVKLVRSIKGGERLYEMENFSADYNITPSQWIDVKALLGETGKTSDGIPGVRYVGDKAAFPLVRQYRDLDGIYASLEQIGASKDLKRCVKHLEDGKDMAYLSKKLATIVTDVPILADLKIEELQLNINQQNMMLDFAALEFKTLLREVEDGKYNWWGEEREKAAEAV